MLVALIISSTGWIALRKGGVRYLKPFMHDVDTLDDLAEHTLIHFRRDQDDWALVAQALGIARVPHRDTITLDSELAALRGAEQGLGVMICVLPAVPVEAGCHFVFKAQHTHQPTLEAAYTWLRERMRD